MRIAVWSWALMSALPVFAAEPLIRIEYRDKPPYSHTEDGRPAGFLLEKTSRIFKLAGLRYEMSEVPVKRITFDIKNNQSEICSPGWYKLAEREQWAQFSLPIHLDKPHLVLLTSKPSAPVPPLTSFRDLVGSDLVLAKVAGVSYGPDIDVMLQTVQKQYAIDYSVTPLTLARMINAGRADYMLIDEEDYGYLFTKGSADLDLTAVRFADMPGGLRRYIMCSKKVSPDTMARINKAIQKAAK